MNEWKRVRINNLVEGEIFNALEKVRKYFSCMNYKSAMEKAIIKAAEVISRQENLSVIIEGKLQDLDDYGIQNLTYDQKIEYLKLSKYVSEKIELSDEYSDLFELASEQAKRTGKVDEQFLAGILSPDDLHAIKSSIGSPEEIADR